MASELDGSRLYSAARMKRRANKNKVDSEVPPRMNERMITNESPIIRAREEVARDFNRKRFSIFDPNAENISPAKQNLSEKIQEKDLKVPDRNFFDANEDSESSNERISVFRENVVEFLSNSADIAKEKQKIKTLSTLLPDEVLKNPTSFTPRTCQTAIMFPDVSGFTQLCQKYDKTGKGGPSRLTAVLNGYLGSMIKVVLSRNGDVCKFGGDAFLCTWVVTEDTNLTEVVHLAIESAIDIQKNCGEHKTDVGVKLRVKIAVAAGTCMFSIIGTRSKKHYVIVGPPVIDVREAEKLCRPGDVIVSPSAWRFVKNYMHFSFTYHSDNKHIKVHDFGPLWKSNYAYRAKGGQMGVVRNFIKSSHRLQIQDLRPFILPPVMRSIDLDRSLDYLTEMRQVAIVFFNITADFENWSLKEHIDTSNEAFKVVSGAVDKAGGGTNKMTLFDKDMAILTVFGLKGFKHALASQVALKCAATCLAQLKHLSVNTVSAGVTTGMAYCGVIGHPMRKEYTVMGHPVNMAARLMCAYQSIVSCDRSTFLNSKMESGHFEVLQLEYLKGIQNAGPFYKFNIKPKRTKLKLNQETQPLLGRTKEVEQFEEFLKAGISEKPEKITFFIVFGTARIGKSRLVARFINIAHNKIFSANTNGSSQNKRKQETKEIHIIPLTEDDFKVSYSTIRLIFQPLLGLGESSSIDEREDKILTKLDNVKDLSLLASFNEIFNVNFELTTQYLSLNHKEQGAAQMSWLKNLYHRCFTENEKWLIVIEDAEFMDDKSWEFLTWCSIESHKALYLLTIGEKKTLSADAKRCLNLIKAKMITLTEIDKWFYLGLACQILGVQAIPVELENTLQQYKSSGNPGWLESFLLTLVQSKSIYITRVSSKKLKSLGLVAPPEFMLSEDVSANRDNSNWKDCLETFESNIDLKENDLRVCLLSPDFRAMHESEGELTMDVMFIKTIDSLEPLEQLILKAGSVLGYNITRNTLEYLITKDVSVDERQIAKAIKNLFEMKILICGKGDLTQKNLSVSKRMILGTSAKNDIACECKGLNIPETCADLPKYANCGYMQFRFPTFRETLYNLLLDDQKKSFHNDCIEFMRKNTYKCKSCNNLRFSNIFGLEDHGQVKLACTITPMHGVRSTTLDPKTNFPLAQNQRFLAVNSSEAGRLTSRNSELSMVGATEVGECQCAQILASVFGMLLEHAVGSGRKDLMLEIQLEYAALGLTMYDIPLTMQLLEEALTLVNQIKEDKENPNPELCSSYIYSKIYTLMGATKLNMGRLDESLELLKSSFSLLKSFFPTSEILVKLLTIKETTGLKMALDRLPGSFVGTATEKTAPFTDLLSECLGLISVVYMYQKKFLFAKYATLLSLNKALQSNRNLYGLCTAYANTIEVFHCQKDLRTCSKLETYAIGVCRKCSIVKIELYEWEAIGQLYKVIFQTRHMRAEIANAVHIGFQSIKIASVIHNTNLKLSLIPDMIFALIQMNRLSEAVSLIQELEYISRLDSDKSSRLWYYTLSLDFQLYTGFTVVTYEACEEFVRAEDLTLTRDPCAKIRLYTSMWLWCVRNAEWELIKTYGKDLKTFDFNEEKPSAAIVFTRLEKLEGLLITLVYKMDAKNFQSINPMFTDIRDVMNKLEKDVKVVKLFRPRFLLLKSYYRQIRYRDNSFMVLLNQARDQALKMQDINTSQWITHLQMLWSNAITQIQREYWNEHCRRNLLEWHESDKETKKPLISYSLPLPKF